MNRRGQGPSATGAAALIAIIAAMMILYILFLPPSDRAELLEEDFDDDDDDTSSKLDGEILLKENPGRLDLIKKKEHEHKISSFNLLSFTSGSIIEEFDSVYVEKSLFGEIDQRLTFDIESLENIDNILFSFRNIESSGTLTITLNGQTISKRKIVSSNPTPIKIPKSALREKSNELIFFVSSPGILFFKTNKYSLEDLKIFGDISDNSGLENTQTFFVTDVEKVNSEKVSLQFMSTCLDNEIGMLDIYLNFQNIYSGLPDCEIPVKIELGGDKLITGENKIRFVTSKGSYSVDQAKITTYLRDEIYQTYYFEVDDEKFELLEDDEIDINMSVLFVKSKNFQDVEVEINGRLFSIDDKERTYMETIDPYIRLDNNAITLRPLDGTVEVVELKIFIIDNDSNDDDD